MPAKPVKPSEEAAQAPKYNQAYFLVHAFYPGTHEKHHGELWETYRSKIDAVARKKDALFVLVGHSAISQKSVELRKYARARLGDRLIAFPSKGRKEKDGLSLLKEKLAPNAGLNFFGEHISYCLDAVLLYYSYDLGVQPDEFSKRVSINYVHSVPRDSPPLSTFLRTGKRRTPFAASWREATKTIRDRRYGLFYASMRKGKDRLAALIRANTILEKKPS